MSLLNRQPEYIDGYFKGFDEGQEAGWKGAIKLVLENLCSEELIDYLIKTTIVLEDGKD